MALRIILLIAVCCVIFQNINIAVSQSHLKFDGTNEMVTIGHGGDYNFGNGPFTIQFKLKSTSAKENMLLLTNNITSNLLALKGIYVGVENGLLYCRLIKDLSNNHIIIDSV